MPRIDWDRCLISVATEGQPGDLRNRDGDNQEWRVGDAMNRLGGKRLTLAQIADKCDERGYRADVPTKASVRFHLNALRARNHVIIE
jgi:hypothetical protein